MHNKENAITKIFKITHENRQNDSDVMCFSAEKPLRPQNGKQTSVDKGLRESWEPSIHLDGRPVDRFVISSNKPMRTHRLTKVDKDSRNPLLEDVGKTETKTRLKREGRCDFRADGCKSLMMYEIE